MTFETFYIINQIPKINRTHWNLPWMSCILKFRSLKISLETLERSFHREEKTETSREASWDIWNSPLCNVYSWCTDNTYTYTYKTHHWLLTEAKEPSSITKNACLKTCRELFHANLWDQASCFVMVCLLTLIQPVFSDQSADKCSHGESCDSWEFDVGSETIRIKKLTATAVCSTVE